MLSRSQFLGLSVQSVPGILTWIKQTDYSFWGHFLTTFKVSSQIVFFGTAVSLARCGLNPEPKQQGTGKVSLSTILTRRVHFSFWFEQFCPEMTSCPQERGQRLYDDLKQASLIKSVKRKGMVFKRYQSDVSNRRPFVCYPRS